jgi:ornithine carbamoyltransferase
MSRAPEHALFMHCLPAHPGEEATAEIITGRRSIVFEQANNRTFGQMAILERALNR